METTRKSSESIKNSPWSEKNSFVFDKPFLIYLNLPDVFFTLPHSKKKYLSQAKMSTLTHFILSVRVEY